MLSFARLKNSSLIRDSFWAVFGNGLSNGLMLIAGIIIARYLGKDIYGEYGLVKTTMFSIGVFATLGLGTSITKYIASAIKNNPEELKGLATNAMQLTFIGSASLACLLLIFAKQVAEFLDDPGLTVPLRFLSIIILFRAIQITQAGILGGYRKYKVIARNNIVSACVMLVLASVLTYYWGLIGALFALLTSQVITTILNFIYIVRLNKTLKHQRTVYKRKELLSFSIPIALQNLSYYITTWGGNIILAKVSTLGQLGILNAALQWNAIVMVIPGLLVNVILSHLSSSVDDSSKHKHILRIMLLCNLACTAIPFIIVYIAAPWICSFYGPTFSGMPNVLRILIFSTIFTCCSNVFSSEFIAQGRNWTLCVSRFIRDIIAISLCYFLVIGNGKESGAISYSIAYVIAEISFFIALFVGYRFLILKKKE